MLVLVLLLFDCHERTIMELFFLVDGDVFMFDEVVVFMGLLVILMD